MDITKLENTLAIKFQNSQLLLTALTHRSYLNEDRKVRESNERLEFLGDSVLSLLVSTELYQRFSRYPEGKLTSLRSSLVRAKTLGELAKELALGEYLMMSKGEERSGGRENKSLLADTFEAVLGAVYLDQGLEAAKTFLSRHLFPLISEVEQRVELIDYKSLLQEKVQEETKISPLYKVLGERGPDHDKTFVVGVYTGERMLASGSGKSKQEAEQTAAHEALRPFGSAQGKQAQG